MPFICHSILFHLCVMILKAQETMMFKIPLKHFLLNVRVKLERYLIRNGFSCQVQISSPNDCPVGWTLSLTGKCKIKWGSDMRRNHKCLQKDHIFIGLIIFLCLYCYNTLFLSLMSIFLTQNVKTFHWICQQVLLFVFQF